MKTHLETDVPSPCLSICRMDGDVCAGCLRTLDEIRAWSRADSDARCAIWLRIGERAALLAGAP